MKHRAPHSPWRTVALVVAMALATALGTGLAFLLSSDDSPAPGKAARGNAPSSPPSLLVASCRPIPLSNVYHPDRLVVRDPCKTVTGVVMRVSHAADGDYHMDVALDQPFRHLLLPGNFKRNHGWLVIEIVPADEPGCRNGEPPTPATGSYDYGICTGAGIAPPPVGQHVSVTGPYVLDTTHGWAEIHPVWAITPSA